jgi:putative restriction endonuclease
MSPFWRPGAFGLKTFRPPGSGDVHQACCRPDLPEVNFWAPSGSTFKALQPGELFLFKLHAPLNYIVGGGVFAHATSLPCSMAWQAFGEANGAQTFAAMRERIVRYRRAAANDRSDFAVGCRILTQPFFFDQQDWIAVPESWSPNIVTLKTYRTDEGDGQRLWDDVQDRLSRAAPAMTAHDQVLRYGRPTLIERRLGQGAFRVLVTDIYRRRCAVTKERTLPALEAAHIRPYSDGGLHVGHNGLLLRRDLHSLFDAGYVTVTPDLKFEVSRRIREEFENGRHYYALHGSSIDPPDRPDCRPDSSSLAWHNENCYRG